MVQLLKSGEEGNFFRTSIKFNDEDDRKAFEEAPDIFEWLEKDTHIDDRATLLITTVLPAVLSDILNCIYEALECSRKAKLSITYMLIRKPLQENLFLLESIIINRLDFAEKLAKEPLKLRGSKAGGLDAHTHRIQQVIDTIGENSRLNAAYIAQLRYDKMADDGFDGVCNLAMHLFTEHKAIRTDPLNINFIFSSWDSKQTQWSFLYSRLPYLLFYTHKIIEFIMSTVAPTHPDYINDMERRISAHVIIWWKNINDAYKSAQLESFVKQTEIWLNQHCNAAGYNPPNETELYRMSRTGAYPKEKRAKVAIRTLKYELTAYHNRNYKK